MNAREVIASALSGDRFNPLEAAVYIEKALTEAGFEIRGGKPCHPRECICAPGDDPPDLCPLGYIPPMTAPADVEALVERLRHPGCVDANCVKCRAADLLLRIAEENRRLREDRRETLEIVEAIGRGHAVTDGDCSFWCGDGKEACKYIAKFIRARAALGDTPAGLNRQGPLSDAG